MLTKRKKEAKKEKFITINYYFFINLFNCQLIPGLH